MKLIKFLIFGLFGLAALAGIAWLSIGFWLSPQDRLEKADVIVAVSGGETDTRTKEAVSLYQEGWAPKLLFSGAALDPASPSNAAAMKAIALSLDVPETAILIEEQSSNTLENAQAVAKIAAQQEWRKIILVTSPYHQRRASLTFGVALGDKVKIINHSSTDEKWRRSQWWANEYSSELTKSELQKALFVWWAGPQLKEKP